MGGRWAVAGFSSNLSLPRQRVRQDVAPVDVRRHPARVARSLADFDPAQPGASPYGLHSGGTTLDVKREAMEPIDDGSNFCASKTRVKRATWQRQRDRDEPKRHALNATVGHLLIERPTLGLCAKSRHIEMSQQPCNLPLSGQLLKALVLSVCVNRQCRCYSATK